MKLRNFVNTCLALLVLVSNTGLAINVHYCGGEVAGVSVANFKALENSSSCDGETAESSCCKNKKVEIKKTTSSTVLIKSFQVQLAHFLVTEQGSFVVANSLLFDEVMASHLCAYYCESNAPPLYKLYSQFIFYA